jgi:hypothetical protein
MLVSVVKMVILVTDREGPEGCETFRVPHYLDNRLTDGGKVVSLTRRPPFTPGIFLVTICVRGHSAAGRIRSVEKNPPHLGSNPRPSGL